MLHMTFRLAYLELTLNHSKGQGQCHAHFDYEYAHNGYSANIPTALKFEVAHGFSTGIFRLDLSPFKGLISR